MTYFRQKPGTKSATYLLRYPFPDIGAFSAVVEALRMKNPLGCTSYYTKRRAFQPIMPVRERYTAKFVYLNGNGKQEGTSSEVYNSVGGYETGVASMISNLANIASHRGKIVHCKDADLFSVTLKCHDDGGGTLFPQSRPGPYHRFILYGRRHTETGGEMVGQRTGTGVKDAKKRWVAGRPVEVYKQAGGYEFQEMRDQSTISCPFLSPRPIPL
jgi:hypothetical protein